MSREPLLFKYSVILGRILYHANNTWVYNFTVILRVTLPHHTLCSSIQAWSLPKIVRLCVCSDATSTCPSTASCPPSPYSACSWQAPSCSSTSRIATTGKHSALAKHSLETRKIEAGIRWRITSEGETDKGSVQQASKWRVGVEGKGREGWMKDGKNSGETEWYWNVRMMQNKNDD